MGNELPTSVPHKPIKRYLKIVNKHTSPIVVLDSNCCWVDANIPFLKLVVVPKKKKLFRLGLEHLFPESQSNLKNTTTTEHFLIWFRETKKNGSRSNTINLEYQTPSQKKGWVNCKLKFFEIGGMTLSQILVSIIKEPTKEDNNKKNTNEKKGLSGVEYINYKSGNLTDNYNTNQRVKKIKSSPSMGTLLNNKNMNEILKLNSSFIANENNDNHQDNNVLETEKNETNKNEDNKENLELQNDNKKENVYESKNEQESDSKVDGQITTNQNSKETNSRTIDETHLDISEDIEEIMEIFNKYKIKQQISNKIHLLLDKILDLHKSCFFTKQEACKQLSLELLDERKKNKIKYVKLESQMVSILENLQSEKRIKRDLLSLNHKYKAKLFSLRKNITSLQKLHKKIYKQNIELKEEQEQEQEQEKDEETNTTKSSIIDFVDSLAKKLLIV
ncbi:hypothetical protein M0813_02648 [Anaeramoeba flamelloides]|uniref:Uncharacterized protein n=1 Tax=Anaeramoeba flamelloides TaxID=1746091 RepID=A0ABQ8YE44_9EUKA|nr:hypothetical protein M0813_02648 [Anaeramoeba flamelloides]